MQQQGIPQSQPSWPRYRHGLYQDGSKLISYLCVHGILATYGMVLVDVELEADLPIRGASQTKLVHVRSHLLLAWHHNDLLGLLLPIFSSSC